MYFNFKNKNKRVIFIQQYHVQSKFNHRGNDCELAGNGYGLLARCTGDVNGERSIKALLIKGNHDSHQFVSFGAEMSFNDSSSLTNTRLLFLKRHWLSQCNVGGVGGTQ